MVLYLIVSAPTFLFKYINKNLVSFKQIYLKLKFNLSSVTIKTANINTQNKVMRSNVESSFPEVLNTFKEYTEKHNKCIGDATLCLKELKLTRKKVSDEVEEMIANFAYYDVKNFINDQKDFYENIKFIENKCKQNFRDPICEEMTNKKTELICKRLKEINGMNKLIDKYNKLTKAINES